MKKVGIFDKREAFKPFEYPEVLEFVDAINSSFWVGATCDSSGEFNFTADVQDFHNNLNEVERNAIKNAMLAISQIEVNVKLFWMQLYNWLPKPEFYAIGATFAESEVRHERAYSRLLEVLGLNEDFSLLLQNPVIQGRVDYLTKYLKGAADNCKQRYTLTLALFSLFIENVSLFSQFAVIKSFQQHKNLLKGIDNVVQATQKEETVHALFGIFVVNKIREEFPEWFNDDFYQKIYRACRKAYAAESNIIDWIFEAGEIECLSKASLKEFVKHRFNESVEMIGADPVFEIDEDLLGPLTWFNEEIHAEVNPDFFNKRPVTYSKKSKSITAEDLF